MPAPNDLSRRVSFGVQAAVVLMMLGAQILIVIGAHREGLGRAGLFAALVTPFAILIFPSSGTSYAMRHDTGCTALRTLTRGHPEDTFVVRATGRSRVRAKD